MIYCPPPQDVVWKITLVLISVSFFCSQVTSVGIHSSFGRHVPASPYSIGRPQSLPAMVHPQPHRVPAVRAGLHHAHCSQRLDRRIRRRVHHSCAGCNYLDNSAVCLMAGLRTAFPLADGRKNQICIRLLGLEKQHAWRSCKFAALFLRSNRTAVQRS